MGNPPGQRRVISPGRHEPTAQTANGARTQARSFQMEAAERGFPRPTATNRIIGIVLMVRGHGKITGPDPGLPVTISWDAYGNTTIVYADGSTEHIAGWGSDNGGGYGDGGGVISVDPPVAISK